MGNENLPAANATPSRATRPDLDWSQVRETVMMLNLAVAQIRNSMADGDDSVNSLTSSFMFMMGQMREIGVQTEALPNSAVKTTVTDALNAVAKKIDDAVISFQFYDKLVQRLTHVTNSLDELASLVSDDSRIFNPHAWRALQDAIKTKYTVAADRQMFEAILKGASVEEVLANAAKHAPSQVSVDPADKIELF